MLTSENHKLPELDGQLKALLNWLDGQPETARGQKALKARSALLEYEAFEIAGSNDTKQVVRLILLAADMDRTADAMVPQSRDHLTVV